MVDRFATDGRVGDAGLRDLEEDAAQSVVHLLIVLVLTLAQALESRTDPDLPQQVGSTECRVQRDVEQDLVSRSRDRDAARGEGRELRFGVRPDGDSSVELSVDLAVCPVTDDGALVRKTRVTPWLVAVVRAEADPHRRKELRVGDVFELGANDAPSDLELFFR